MNLARNALLMSCLCAAPAAWADVFEWEYIDPLNPALGKQQSETLALDGRVRPLDGGRISPT